MPDTAITFDDREVQEKLKRLQSLNGKNMSVLAWKAGKEALFAMMKATPVAKNYRNYMLVTSDRRPVLNRSGQPIFAKKPGNYGATYNNRLKDWEEGGTGRYWTKIKKGKRYLSSSWYTARLGFRIKTGKVGQGAKAAGSFFSGTSKTKAELIWENSVYYSAGVDLKRNITNHGLAGIERWLNGAIRRELDKLTA